MFPIKSRSGLAAWTNTVQAAFRCDLAYEVIPADDLSATLDTETLLSLVRVEAVRADEVIEVVVMEGGLDVSPAAVTWGGWRGKSRPALHVTVHAPLPEEGWAAARRLAERFAWLYRQEAVLLACSAPEAGEELVQAYSVAVEPASFFEGTEELFAFFGTLMASAQVADLGYTRRDGAFWTIDFAGNLEEPLGQTTHFFESLSARNLRFTLLEEPVAVALVGASDAAAEPRLRELRDEIDAQLKTIAAD